MMSTDVEQPAGAGGGRRLLVQTLATVGGGALFALALFAVQHGAARPSVSHGAMRAPPAAPATPAATPTAPQPTAQAAATVFLVASDAQAADVQQNWDDAQWQRWQISHTPPDPIVILVVPEGKAPVGLAKVFLAGYLGAATTIVDLRSP